MQRICAWYLKLESSGLFSIHSHVNLRLVFPNKDTVEYLHGNSNPAAVNIYYMLLLAK